MRACPGRPRLLGLPFVSVGTSLLLTMMTFGISLPVLPRLVTGPLGGGSQDVGFVFGAFALASVAARPIVGASGDRSGRRVLIAAGGTASVVGLLAHVIVSDIAQLVVARAVAGAGYGAVMVGLMTAGLDMASESRRGEAANYLMIAMQLGLGLGPVFGEWTLVSSGHTAVWAVAAGAGAAAILFALAALPRESHRQADKSLPRMSLNSKGLLPGAVALLAVTAFTGYLTFVPLHADELGMDQVATVLLTSSVVVILVRISGARLVDKAGPAFSVTLGLVLEALGLLLMALWVTPGGLYASTIVMSAGLAVVAPSLLFAAVRKAAVRERARVVATFTMLLDSGMAVGPVTFGFVAAAIGYRGSFAFGSVVTLGALAVTAWWGWGAWSLPRSPEGPGEFVS